MEDKPPDFTDQMPLYQCHKQVRALKIKEIIKKPVSLGEHYNGFTYDLVFEDQDFPPYTITAQFMKRSHCKVGGYFIQYEDGYLSYSPAEAFEDGYTRLSSREKPLTIEELNRIGEQALKGYPKTNYNPNETREK